MWRLAGDRMLWGSTLLIGEHNILDRLGCVHFNNLESFEGRKHTTLHCINLDVQLQFHRSKKFSYTDKNIHVNIGGVSLSEEVMRIL